MTSCGETDAGVVELREERFNGRRWVPRCIHAKLVGIQLVLRVFFVVGPEMGKDGEAGDVAITEGRIIEIRNAVVGDSIHDLGAESLVDFVVGSEDGTGAGGVDAVEFGDLLGGEAGSRVFADRNWIDWWKKRDSGEEGEVGCREGETDVTMEAVAASMRGDRGGVGVKLGLSGAKSSVGWGRGGGGKGREFDGWEGGSDDTGGDGNGSHYQLLLMN